MAPQKNTVIEITTGTILRIALVLLGVLFLFVIRDIVLIILVAVVIASAVEPLVNWFGKYHIPRVLAVLITYVGGIAGFIAIFTLLIPPLASDFQQFITRLPTLVEAGLRQLQAKVGFLPLDSIVFQLGRATSEANSYVDNAVAGIFTVGSSLFSGIFAFVFVIVISFYLAVQEDGIADVLRIVTPKEHEAYVLGLWARSQRKIGRWLQGQMLLGLIIGVIVFIALTILQVQYAFILSILSALFEIIPYFGPVMAAIPAIAVASIQEPLLGLLVAGIYFIVQQMENHLIYPQVVRKTVGVPPLLAIIAILIGGKLAGMMGVIIAIPLAVVLVEYLNDIVDRKKNII
ncbi:MAG: AI-2E family transporter [Patescibacteria group bacterium]